ncbi:BrxA family protein [Acinetobacter venetianus]|uniref:BrxA family protein n=1 Tax=Acinetobacter venetianus TaxID=52133 RepID=UPI003851793F
MRLDPYLGDVTGLSSLMVDESRKIAGLLLEDLSEKQWTDAIEQQNIIQKSSFQTARRQARCIRYRLKDLPNEYLKVIENGTSKEVKQLLLFALLNHSTLALDFFKYAVIEPQTVFKSEMPKRMWESFLNQQYNESLGQLADSTLIKIRKNLIASFVEAGYLENSKTLKFLNVFVEPVIYQVGDELGRADILKLMAGKV